MKDYKIFPSFWDFLFGRAYYVKRYGKQYIKGTETFDLTDSVYPHYSHWATYTNNYKDAKKYKNPNKAFNDWPGKLHLPAEQYSCEIVLIWNDGKYHKGIFQVL